MNTELIKFIELSLTDGVISDKEREVIFRKAAIPTAAATLLALFCAIKEL